MGVDAVDTLPTKRPIEPKERVSTTAFAVDTLVVKKWLKCGVVVLDKTNALVASCRFPFLCGV